MAVKTLAQIKAIAKNTLDGSQALAGEMFGQVGTLLQDLITNIVAGVTTSVAITNKASGGSIGSAATTVDIASIFIINQTTAGQTLTIASPTTAAAIKYAILVNKGTAAFTFDGGVILPGASKMAVWDGAAWRSKTNTSFPSLTNLGTTNYTTAVAVSNLASGGALGTAAATVDIATLATLNQTTAAQAITLPSPTLGAASVSQVFKVKNIGSQSFTFYGQTVAAGGGIGEAWWTGSAWI